MYRLDVFGEPVTLPDRASVEAWNAAALAFLGHAEATPTHLARLLDHVPLHAGSLALKGLLLALLARRETMEMAEGALRAAREGRCDANGRELALVAALARVLAGEPRAAIEAIEAVLAKAPGDTLLVKLSHSLLFLLGDGAGMRRSVERALPAHDHDHPGRGYLLGCHAFALEETGAYREAHARGSEALALEPRDAWGLHAVTHVYDMTGDALGGLRWLDGREAAWQHCNNFRFHVWWHRALMLLDLGRLDEALRLYDDAIRSERTDDYRDIANATSLLARLQLEGIDVGRRWDELADLAERRTGDGCLLFADLHYLLALTNARRPAAEAALIARIERDGVSPRTGTARRMARPGVDVAHALAAFGRGDYARAFRRFSAARSDIRDMGGSHAQRDVFDRLTIEAGLRSGNLVGAAAVLDDRSRRRGRHVDGFAASRRRRIADAAKRPCLSASGA